MAWTTNPGDRDIRWYPRGETVDTGQRSSLRKTGKGEHYYLTERKGMVPVGSWKVHWEQGQCIHNAYPAQGNDYHGVPFGRQTCQKPHYSGWLPYCADCGGAIGDLFVYMSREAASTIGTLGLGDNMSYFYLCPYCSNLEQGGSLGIHLCKAISQNQYRVRYDANCSHHIGFMADSIHMYRNATLYEGDEVVPTTHLSENRYIRAGYVFDGWNTEPDGAGTGYGDGEEIWNLTDTDYHIDAEKGTVVLYAQWKAVDGTLYIDPDGGRYNGSADVTVITQGYGTSYRVEEDVEPPLGHRVSFECNGGGEIPDIMGTMHFAGWNRRIPFHGNFHDGIYIYESPEGESDLLTACYEYDSIILPAAEKEGSSFGGWYFDAAFERPAGAAGDRITPTADMTLYARWVDLVLHSEENYQAGGGKGAVDLSWSQADGQNKWYLLYQSLDGKNWNKIFQEDDICREKNVDETVSHEGFARTFIVEDTGIYSLTAAGAQGSEQDEYTGGKGGRVTAVFRLERGEILTCTVGGTDGYNGGGTGDMYGNGGGCTVVSSDRKGVLLVAGGGGGATSAGNGGDGGLKDGLLETGYGGGTGGAGGGGGFRGGAAGERIVHHHTDTCYRDSSYDGLKGAVISEAYNRHVCVEENGDGDCPNCGQYDLERAGSRENPIRVRGNTSVNVQAVLWKQICRNGELWSSSYLRIYDQNGNCFFSRNLSNIIHDTHTLRKQIIDSQTRYWEQSGSRMSFPRFHTEFTWMLPRTDGNTNTGGYDSYWSVRNSDGTSGVMGEYKRETGAPVVQLWGGNNWGNGQYPLYPEHNYRVLGDTGYNLENTPLFFVRNNGCHESGVLLNYTVNIPAGVTGIYVEAVAEGGAAVSHDLVFSVITRVSLQGGRETLCGMSEGQVIASRPSYGGSSYVNEEYAISYVNEPGMQEGDGSFGLKSVVTGFTEECSMEGVCAPDLAAPEPVEEDSIIKEGLGSGKVLVSWEKPQDHGTIYYHMAESFFAGSDKILCRSNETCDTLVSGVKGYYYCVDGSPDTETAAGADYTESAQVTVGVGKETCYLHLAAVDVAGNVSGTIHVPLDADAAARPLHTQQLLLDTEADHIYPAGERSWYVRSDGVTPITLGFGAYIDGLATERYQINHALFVSEDREERISAYSRVTARNQALTPGSIMVPDSMLDFSSDREMFLNYYPYTRACREEGNKKLSVTQKYTVGKEASGKVMEVYPRAGADWNGEIFYSSEEEDRGHGLVLIGDSEPPVIRGMELLENLSLIDRRVSAPVLNLTAWDELSGVKDFYLTVYNMDNNCSRKFVPDAAGIIRVELAADDPLFSGDFTVTARAVDNVGNEATVSEGTTEFGLTARIERILTPHDPVFRNGESGILSIAVWGYPDYVEIEFPEEMAKQDPGLNRRIDYAGSPRYSQEEEIRFMIPLYTPANADYAVKVRAYKGDRQLEQYPEISVVEVSGTVLDDFRTRLR